MPLHFILIRSSILVFSNACGTIACVHNACRVLDSVCFHGQYTLVKHSCFISELPSVVVGGRKEGGDLMTIVGELRIRTHGFHS